MPEGIVVQASEALPAIRGLMRKLELEVQASANDPTVQLSIMENILAATTEEEVYERQETGTVASKEFTNRPFRLRMEDITWKKSADTYINQGAFPYYAILRVTDMETGEEVVIDTGAATVVASLVALIDIDNSGDGKSGPFSRYGTDGKPLQFVPKPMASGNVIILLKPVRLAEEVKVAKSKR